MNIQKQGFPLDLGASFTEDAPRPPVPGEEGELVSTDPRPVSYGFCSGKGAGVKGETSTATPRRSDLDLGYEPEGSASPTPPYLKWAESLHSLLDDQDGISLFRTFLKQEDCADLLDFWFACTGFRKLEPCDSNEEKRLKLARAIYRKYILDSGGIVSRQTKPATKSFIKDCIMRQQIDPAMFDQAQTEIQSTMEENTYPSFLKSDIYLEYTRTGSESPKVCSDQSSGSGTGKGVSGYLPTLNEDEEWKCNQDVDEDNGRDPAPPSRLTQKLLLETAAPRASSGRRYSEGREFRGVTGPVHKVFQLKDDPKMRFWVEWVGEDPECAMVLSSNHSQLYLVACKTLVKFTSGLQMVAKVGSRGIFYRHCPSFQCHGDFCQVKQSPGSLGYRPALAGVVTTGPIENGYWLHGLQPRPMSLL
ncbi:axin-1-like [Carlito syrichta]|uniref:Axin-1-like n=2 Tax=Carlito syrichta TaxID=1868482 RepID=A0A1U7U9M8_CARSF|nr:axin-1-like [Carlito syrichta]